MNSKYLYIYFTTIALMLATYSGKAQVLLSENFQNGIPSNWVLIDADGHTPDSSVAYVNNAWVGTYDELDTNNHVAESTSFYTPSGQSDDWLISPPIVLTANNFIKWRARALDPQFPDGYEVRISTVTGSPTVGNFLANAALLNVPAENAAWTTRVSNLNPYAGQTVRIAFRNHSNDQYLLDLDDVVVGTYPTLDAMIDSATVPEYNAEPLRLAQPITFGARAKNNGVDTIRNVKLKVQLTKNTSTNIVFSDSSASVTLIAPGNSFFLSIPGFYLPTDTGNYTITYKASTTSNDTFPNNDTLSVSLAITDSVYARDLGNITGSLGIGDSLDGYIGQTFEVTDTIALTSITMALVQPIAGDTVSGVIFRLGTTPDSIVATTDLYFINSTAPQQLTLPIKGGNKVLLPGRYVVAAKEYFHYLSLATTNDIFTLGTTWIKSPAADTGTWYHNEVYNIHQSYVIRPNFGVCTLRPDSIVLHQPNCSKDSTGSAQVFISAGYGAVNYLWSNGDTTNQINSIIAQSPYSIVATDEWGCKFVDTLRLTSLVTITDSLGTVKQASDYGGQAFVINIVGGIPPYTFAWNTGSTNDSITGLLSGTYTVTITDSLGCSKVDSVFVGIGMGGINDIGNLLAFAAYPNPTNELVNISIQLTSVDNINLELTNTVGQIVWNEKYPPSAELITQLNLKNLPSGFYLLSVRTTSGTKVVKIMKE